MSATGAAPLTYQWFRNDGGTLTPVGTSSSTYVTPNLTATTKYRVRVSNSCGSVDSSDITITIPTLSAPTGVTATLTSSNTITVTWSGTAGADHYYQVERRSGGGAFAVVGTPASSPFVDGSRAAGVTYVYRVHTVDATGQNVSAASNSDLATNMTFSTITTAAAVRNTHLQELLTALNAVRAANGTAATTWTAILPGGVPAPAVGVAIYATQLSSLRSAFVTALGSLGISAPGYTNPLAGGRIFATDVTQLQALAQ